MIETEAPNLRRNVTLDGLAVEQLADLRTNTEAASDSEVLRAALLYHEQFVEDYRHGVKIFFRNSHGDETEMPFISRDANLGGGETVKRSIILSESAGDRIEALRELTAAKSDSDVIKQALAFYDAVVKFIIGGHTMVQRDERGREFYPTIPVAKARRPRTKSAHGAGRRILPIG